MTLHTVSPGAARRHAGCYTTTARRATMHDVPDTPQFQAWRTGRFARREGATMENPNDQPAGSAPPAPPTGRRDPGSLSRV